MWTLGVDRLQLRGKVFELRVSNRTDLECCGSRASPMRRL